MSKHSWNSGYNAGIQSALEIVKEIYDSPFYTTLQVIRTLEKELEELNKQEGI